ncbi:MAG: ABC transporter permease [Bacteroidota bacterium]
MLQSYLKVAIRNLLKNKAFSLINVFGLGLGMAAAILILHYVTYERSFDRFHSDSEDIYRVTVDYLKDVGIEGSSARVAPAVSATLKDNFPQIEQVTRMIILGEGVLSFGDQAYREKEVFLVDQALFEIFDYQGIETGSFDGPFQVMLSRTAAEKLFNQVDPTGEEIEINSANFDGSARFVVKGVYDDVPQNAHIRPHVLISYATLHEFVGHQFDDSWTWDNTYSYVKLTESAKPDPLMDQFHEQIGEMDQSINRQEGAGRQYRLQPLSDIHLHSKLQHEASANGSESNVYFMLIMGILVLLMVYFNYINLLTAKSIDRAREIGVRKTIGASHLRLFKQFTLESLIVNLIALMLAFTLVQLCYAYFSDEFGGAFLASPWQNSSLWLWFILMILILIPTSNFYPALVMTRFNPVEVLKNNVGNKASGESLRKWLVSGQFALSILFMIVTMVILKQMRYIDERDLGVAIEQNMIVEAPKSYAYGQQNDFGVFKRTISELPGVINVSASSEVPGKSVFRFSEEVTVNSIPNNTVFSIINTSPSFLPQYQAHLISGKYFQKGNSGEVIINEAAARRLGFSEFAKAIGVELSLGRIAGVITDYHQEGLKNAITPVIYTNREDNFHYYSIKLTSDQKSQVFDLIQAGFKEHFPDSPFYHFMLEDFYANQYTEDERFGSLFAIFSVLAIVIANIGLLGLILYQINRRAKEMSIRKILGCSISGMILLLSKDYLKLVILGALLAVPVAVYGAKRWLESYAYHTHLDLTVYLLPISTVLSVTCLVLGSQTIGAANANPATNLRKE